jgi:hypothetical protein
MIDRLKQYISDCENYEKQRIAWLRLSGFVAVAVLIVIADWSQIERSGLMWYLISAGLLVIVVWWYWTMMIIRTLLNQKKTMTHLLVEMNDDLQKLKEKMPTRH